MKLMNLIILTPVIMYLGMNYNDNDEFSSVEKIQKFFLNKNIKSTSNYNKKYYIKNEIINDDESGTTWTMVSFSQKGIKKLSMETSWKKKEIIKRIYVFDSSVTFNKVRIIGVPLKSILGMIKNANYDESFGSFYLSSRTNSNVSFELDISKLKYKSNDFLKWERNLDKIPKSLVVSTIIINSR